MVLAKSRVSTFLLIVLFLWALINFANANRRGGRKKQWKLFEKKENTTRKDDNRQGKFFSLFNVVTFQNEGCTSQTTTSTGDGRQGTCYTTNECADRSGSASGTCAAGFGVCCVFIRDGTGSTTVSENCTYIQNPGFPSALTMSTTQTFTVNKVCDDVCFLRLDFEQFTLMGTNGSTNPDEGVCTDTFMATTPTQVMVPVICGENSGEHIYIDIGANPGDTATLTFNTNALAGSRFYDIKINQIECTNHNRPRDPCCLQWHTGCTGRLMSFNYANMNDNHLNNQQYSICIRQECGFCCVQYQVCPDQLCTIPGGHQCGWSFDTSFMPAMGISGAKGDNLCVLKGGMFTNVRDHIGIQQSGASCSPAGGDCDRAINNRYCGGFFNQVKGVKANVPICDCTGPFSVDVFFNKVNDMDAIVGNPNTKQSRGFCLEYMQIPC